MSLTFLTAAEDPYVSRGGQVQARARYACSCGKEIVARQSEVRCGRKTSCGCLTKKRPVENFYPEGTKFNHLTVVRELEPLLRPAADRKNPRPIRRMLCKCACGSEIECSLSTLLSGTRVSCGCARTKHGHAKTQSRTYSIWRCMINRGTNPGNAARKRNYFDRGIRVCKRWRKFENFLADMGECPTGLTLDRKNNDKGYSPNNCRWATMSEQLRNTRRTIFVDYQGERRPMRDVVESLGLDPMFIYNRMHRGATFEEALAKPKQKRTYATK